MQISTLPALSRGPLTKRTVPLVQRWAAAFMMCVVKRYDTYRRIAISGALRHDLMMYY